MTRKPIEDPGRQVQYFMHGLYRAVFVWHPSHLPYVKMDSRMVRWPAVPQEVRNTLTERRFA